MSATTAGSKIAGPGGEINPATLPPELQQYWQNLPALANLLATGTNGPAVTTGSGPIDAGAIPNYNAGNPPPAAPMNGQDQNPLGDLFQQMFGRRRRGGQGMSGRGGTTGQQWLQPGGGALPPYTPQYGRGPDGISGYELWEIDNDGLIAESKGHFDSDDYRRQLKGD